MIIDALISLKLRIKGIDNLMGAHTAIRQARNADKKYAKSDKNQVRDLIPVFAALVDPPGRGKPAGVESINSAAIVLLSAYLQSYIEDVFRETCDTLFEKQTEDIEIMKESNLSRWGNPSGDNIDSLFNKIGISNIIKTSGISWQNCSNDTVKEKLKKLNELRNEIAHGKKTNVNKSHVTGYKSFIENFAQNFCEILEEKVKSLTP